jgi:HAD superfamily hydrolase (TIGR01549 family)
MIRAIIFDCFGVIITDALALLCAELQTRDSAAAQQVADIIGMANHGLIDRAESTRRIAEIFGMNPDELRTKVDSGEVKDRRVLELAESLRKSYKIAMLSNIGSVASLTRRFTSQELQTSFDAVITSGEIGFAKPEPEAYEVVADRLERRLTECVMIDDREEYCDGARAVGMQVILYKNFEQAKTKLKKLLADSEN